MSCMKKAAITEALIDVVNSDTVMTDSCIVKVGAAIQSERIE